jgi:hypothetical protein
MEYIQGPLRFGHMRFVSRTVTRATGRWLSCDLFQEDVISNQSCIQCSATTTEKSNPGILPPWKESNLFLMRVRHYLNLLTNVWYVPRFKVFEQPCYIVHWKFERLPEGMKLRKAPVALELPADVQAKQQLVQRIKKTATGVKTLSKSASQLKTQSATRADSTLFDPKIKQPTPTGERQDNGGGSGDTTLIGLANGEGASEKRGRTLSIYTALPHMNLERREV